MHVILVTSWNKACGIAEHSAMLKQAVEAADSRIAAVPCPGLVQDPFSYYPRGGEDAQVLHLNYQAGLLSRWTPDVLRTWRSAHPAIPVVITFHDTGVPNSPLCRELAEMADQMVVHEPFDDLPKDKVQWWMLGVPDEPADEETLDRSWADGRPVLATFGFPFPWKCYNQLAAATARAGWAFHLVTSGADDSDIHLWRQTNPWTLVTPEFVPRPDLLNILQQADALAFTYVTHNTGQAAPIYTGLAAHTPIIALSTCRQYRALLAYPPAAGAICWAETFHDVTEWLARLEKLEERVVWSRRVDRAAATLSWSRLGRQYAHLYQELTA